MSNVIWALQWFGWEDGWNGDYESCGFDIEDDGWYSSKEKAQAECDRRNAEVLDSYDRYVKQVELENESARRSYEERLADYNILVNAGRRVEPPNQPYYDTPYSYERWLHRYYQRRWAPISIAERETDGE